MYQLLRTHKTDSLQLVSIIHSDSWSICTENCGKFAGLNWMLFGIVVK